MMRETTFSQNGVEYQNYGYGDYKPGLESIVKMFPGTILKYYSRGIVVNVGTRKNPRVETRPACWVAWKPQGGEGEG